MKPSSSFPHSTPGKGSRETPVPEPGRLRQIPPQFSWVDHRLVRHGHLRHCGEPAALALYLFLVTVGDRRGLSYYSEDRLLEHLPLTVSQLRGARRRLMDTGLIAYRKPFYQVLSLDGLDRVTEEFMDREVRLAPAPKAKKQSKKPLSSPGTGGDEPEPSEGEGSENSETIRKALHEAFATLRKGAAPEAVAEQRENPTS